MTEEGEAVQILKSKDNDRFELNIAALESILLQDNVKEKYVVVISVAGVFRKGKSFLLSFILRYLNSKGSTNWMGTMDEPLKGFHWKASQDRVTTGILMWSKPFFEKLPSGQEVVVLLMDTQGTFDSSSTEKENCTIFALSTMLSSVLIYNISENILETDLLNLQRFAEYGKLALQENVTPFQKLIFLVRDFPLVRHWGAAGGKSLLEKRMEVEKEEHAIVRELIKSSFSELSCFLMPPPGKAVTSKEDFDGKLQDIDEDFRHHLKTFITDLLASNELIVKIISGNKVTARNLLEYFRGYMDIFSSDKVPTPTNILLGQIKCDNMVVLTEAKALYSERMRELSDNSCTIGKFYMEEQRIKLEELHEKTKMDALALFDGKRKIGGDTYSKEYRKALIEYMDVHYTHLRKQIGNQNALQSIVQQIESWCEKKMDEMFGDTPYVNTDKLESTYSSLEAMADKHFHATADALNDADKLIELYEDKLNMVMLKIWNYYAELNDKKHYVERIAQRAVHEYKRNMEWKFHLESDALSELEFRKACLQIQSEALTAFDSIRSREKVIAFYKDKTEKDMQSIAVDYEVKNNQKLLCEEIIQRVLFDKMSYKEDGMSFAQKAKQSFWRYARPFSFWKPKMDESFLKEAEKTFRDTVGKNPFADIYAAKLKEKIKKWSTYESFVSSAKTVYEEEMKKLINETSRKVSKEDMDNYHTQCKRKAVDSFQGDKDFWGYKVQLEQELDYLYLYYKGLNEGKSNCVIL